MAQTLKTLRKKSIYLGTSSWKYEGWKGLVYQKDYPSKKGFNDECLKEYGKTYPTVGVDHTYYTWPRASQFKQYIDQTPPGFKFGLKATEEVTVFHYPKHARYGKKSGTQNPHFLDAALFKERFLEPLRPYWDRMGPIMFEFSQFFPGSIASGSDFTAQLGKFLSALKDDANELSFAVELRNKSWLKPAYFEMLISHHTSHVFNSWTRMPPVEEQLALTQDFKFRNYVARLLLEPGNSYQSAVDSYSPYDKVQNEQPKIRKAAASLITRAMDQSVPAYVFVNNRLEGCAPRTIDGILSLLD